MVTFRCRTCGREGELDFGLPDGYFWCSKECYSEFTQQACPDAVKGPGLGQRTRHDGRVVPQYLCRDAFDPAGHFGRRAPGKGQEEDAPRIGSVDDQMRHAVGQRVCLSGPRPGDYQERIGETVIWDPHAMFHGPSLLRIELGEISGGHGRIIPLVDSSHRKRTNKEPLRAPG